MALCRCALEIYHIKCNNLTRKKITTLVNKALKRKKNQKGKDHFYFSRIPVAIIYDYSADSFIENKNLSTDEDDIL